MADLEKQLDTFLRRQPKVGAHVYIAKTAVVGMTRYQAVEWAERNVQVNAIAPGWIETPMTATMQPARRQWVEDHAPQHKYGWPKDIAGSKTVKISERSSSLRISAVSSPEMMR